jgi:phosphohistidine phosphatase
MDLLTIVQGAGGVESLLLVGHNPSIHALAAALAGRGPDKLLQSVRNNFQPGTLAVYEFSGAWADIQPEGGLLKDLMIPAE